MITKQDIQAATSYIFRSSFVSEDQARKAMVRAGNNATRKIIMTFRGKLFKKAFDRASRGKDINSFEKQEKVDGLNSVSYTHLYDFSGCYQRSSTTRL